MTYVTVEGGFTYVADMDVRPGDMIVVELVRTESYMEVEKVSDRAPSFRGPLKQVVRVVRGRSKEAAAMRQVKAAEVEMAQARLALTEARKVLAATSGIRRFGLGKYIG